jgi:nucleoside-diphosphate-sugar epimerase
MTARIPGLRPGDRVLVTGCAGFLGSHLSETLLDRGHEVVGVDCFTDYYARELKEANLERLRDEPDFTFNELDLSDAALTGLLDGIDLVIHLAAQPGVRGSFGEGFERYVRNNVLATQRLLEEATEVPLQGFVYASSSSVYGNSPVYPTSERMKRRPVSPYGMTKLATEELACVYHRCYGVPAVGLRYFTAYGPRQRPDMAFTRFLRCALADEPIPLNGDGSQIRDFTYVRDVVDGTIAAASAGRAGTVYNIGGGTPVRLSEAVAIISELVGRRIATNRRPVHCGDPHCTSCDDRRARRDLGFSPSTTLRDGLAAQLEWLMPRERAPVSV